MGVEVQCQSLLPSHRLDEIWGETGDFLGTATSRPSTANIYIYVYTNHIYQPTTNQPSPPSTTDHQSSTIHRSTVPSLSQRHGSCRTGQFHLLHQVFGLGRNPQMMDVHQDGDFMDILWGFSQKLSLSHLIKINIV